ncbi:response regulator [Brevundimonas nasdae]|nr:response regulator [Brevundimonas nasdae]
MTILAAVICVVGISGAIRLIERARIADGPRRMRLAIASGLTAALSAWATHFVAMQGFIAGVPLTYDTMLTVVSLGVAVVTVTFAACILIAGFSRLWRTMGVLIAISGIGAMHYTGMAALKVAAHISWEPWLVAASIGCSLLIAGLSGFFYKRAGLVRLIIAGVGGALAIIVLHFFGMAALNITPDPTYTVHGGLSPVTMQAVATAIAATVGGIAASLAYMAYSSRAGALRRIREAVDAMPDGLSFFDLNDRLVLWNARYAEVNPEMGPYLQVGTPYRDLLMVGINEGRYLDAVGREEAWITERLTARRQLSSSSEEQTSNGRWLRIQDRRTSEGGIVTVCNDITILKRDAQALAEARDAAEEANVAKSHFLANMSHEIRTPLNGVIGLAQALAKTELTPTQREMLDLMQSSGQTLQTLLGDILDLARVESGKLELTEDAFHLAAAAREAAQLYAEIAREKALSFHVDIDIEEGLWVRGDAVRLKQVLTNLISNAVKFTTEGFVSLTVQYGPDHNNLPSIRFTVEDTGIGFDAATRTRLFQRFEQADGAITRRFGGSGLGLSICRHLAEMMGGALDCESEPGGGSAFILTMPLIQCDAPAHKEPKPVPSSKDADGLRRRVLVADDHPVNRRVIELILTQADVETIMAENGVEALDAFRAGHFDLVLMDMQMPVMDGLTATQEIRLLELTEGRARTPIIMLTANAMPEHVAAGRAAGVDHHLAKPFNAAELLALTADPSVLLKDQVAAA